MTDISNKSYINTTVTSDPIKSLKKLSDHEGKRLNQLLEEAIQDHLKKQEKEPKTTFNLGVLRAE